MTLSVGFRDPSLHRCLVHAGQQGTLSRSNAYNRRHAYARPRQPGLETRTSNMPASTCQHRARHRNMASVNDGRNKASNQQTRTAKRTTICIALQYSKVSCRRMHSCRSKTLKHAALLKHASRCRQCKHRSWKHFTNLSQS